MTRKPAKINASYLWDFFLAHAGADKTQAEELYGYLHPRSRVFLDSREVLLGDDWDRTLQEAQQSSMITVVLISSRSGRAYYEREEIATAIALAREDETKHRVIPVFLEDLKAPQVPYGLRLKHGVHLSADFTLYELSDLLLKQLPRFRTTRFKSPPVGPRESVPSPSLANKVSLSISAQPGTAGDFSEDSIHTLSYEVASDKKLVRIVRSMPYLSMLENGGTIQPIQFTWVPFDWRFPELDFKVLNNSGETILLTDLIFEVKESRQDPSPVLVIKPDSYGSNALHFELMNDGWGPARGVRAQFHLIPLERDASERPIFRGPYPYKAEIGDVRELVNVSIRHAFETAGVDFKRLKAVGQWTSMCGDMVTVEDSAGKERRMTEKKFLAEQAACLGPFRQAVMIGGTAVFGALVSGVLKYGAKSIDGDFEECSVNFETVVWIIDANRKGAPRPPSYQYSTKFEVSGKDYERRVSISQELKAGEADRFLVKIGFEKSSRHSFRARLIYNGQCEILSPDIELLGFVPRSGIRFLRQARLQRTPG